MSFVHHKLGIGITFFPEIYDFIKENSDLITVLEIEPQTHWYEVPSKNGSNYKVNREDYNRIKSLPQEKIIHSVDTPVGGMRSVNTDQIHLLKETIEEFNSHWFSEHLGFNTAEYEGKGFKTNFFLPPIQNYSGIKNCVNSINEIYGRTGYPFAIENGVNYLKGRDDEISDSKFINSILERANCGLLLDLHNLWTNQINGRESIKEFLKSISLDRIWEIHLAGGNQTEEYYVDSHLGGIQEELIEITKEVIRYFPNLSAIIFEMNPSYLMKIDYDFKFIYDQMTILRKIWLSINNTQSISLKRNYRISENINWDYFISAEKWENMLGSLAIDKSIQHKNSDIIFKKVSSDPGIKMIRKIIFESRKSMISSALRFTITLLLLSVGIKGLNNIFKKYFSEFFPQSFGYIEAKNFQKFMKNYDSIEWLNECLLIDIGLSEYKITGKSQVLVFKCNPIVLIQDLLNYRLPHDIENGIFETEIGSRGIRLLKE
jgi:uncharacterized protein (UPF0276 family)